MQDEYMDKNKFIKSFTIVVIFLLFSCGNSNKEKVKIYYKKINENVQLPNGIKFNGLKQGIWIEYDTIGTIRSVESFINGIPEGELRLFDGYGSIIQKSEIHNGVYNGVYEYFGANGKLLTKGIYLNNKKNGNWFYFDEKGNPIKKEIWKNGELE
jgi:antitoxin component YwqK of YwqJK toxin-antitoxin module